MKELVININRQGRSLNYKLHITLQTDNNTFLKGNTFVNTMLTRKVLQTITNYVCVCGIVIESYNIINTNRQAQVYRSIIFQATFLFPRVSAVSCNLVIILPYKTIKLF